MNNGEARTQFRHDLMRPVYVRRLLKRADDRLARRRHHMSISPIAADPGVLPDVEATPTLGGYQTSPLESDPPISCNLFLIRLADSAHVHLSRTSLLARIPFSLASS